MAAAVMGLEADRANNKELEVLMADMETRLRSTVLRVVRPALDQVADLSTRFEGMVKQVEKHDEVMYMAERLRGEMAQQTEFTKLLADQMASRDSQQRSLERSVTENFSELRSCFEDLSQRVEEARAELTKQQRNQERAWEEMQRGQQQAEDSARKLLESVVQTNRKAERIRDDLMEVVRELQRQREDLLEDLFGEGKGLKLLASDLANLTHFVAPLPDLQLNVATLKTRQDGLEVASADTKECVRLNKEGFNDFSREIRESLGDLKGHFQEEANRLVAHHATMMKDIRWEYVEEVNYIKTVHGELMLFRDRIEKACSETSELAQRESRRIDALHREIVQDMDELSKKRKKDRVAWENELRETRRDLEREQEMARVLRVNVEFLSRLLGLALEGQRVASALSVQDFADRGAERWLALTTEAGRRPQPPLTTEVLERQRPRRYDGKEGSRPTHEMVTVEFRKGLVSGEYLPGRVVFGGVAHDRRDLLLAHHRLLQRAHAAYTRGPFGEDSVPAAVGAAVSSQPGANGGVAAGEAPAAASSPAAKTGSRASARMREDADSPGAAASASPTKPSPKRGEEDGRGSLGRPANGGGGRQRPGSQGQPQAVGSRGTLLGPLGETAPPLEQTLPRRPGAGAAGGASTVPPVRLPSIVSEGQHPGAAGGGIMAGSLPKRSLTAR